MRYRSTLRAVFLSACALATSAGGVSAQDSQPAHGGKPVHQNRLAKEKSPYLRQHATNPVDWYPWGEEAMAKAKKENKPIFLSIGYATCHWCHVMERESFENEEVAKYMNEHYVSIKVDREERPDVDEIYMSAVQTMTGSGGWPLSVFLTPEGKPFSGGTYFPQPARYGRRSFLDVLKVIKDVWADQREAVVESADKISEHITKITSQQQDPTGLTVEVLHSGYRQLSKSFDAANGGFGRGQTKFPMPHNLSFLHRYYHRTQKAPAVGMTIKTLDAMLEGGLRDHLAGGFHRYSTDREWMIPHFEKMLYDQAGLLRAYVEVYLITGQERFGEVARETLDFVLAKMRSPEGAFTSAWDADSEGVEGKCYVWTQGELKTLLGDSYEPFAARYSVSKHGNWHEFKGVTHLQYGKSLAQVAKLAGKSEAETKALLADCRAKLLVVRERRVPPLHDDKVLADWNGLMIGAAAYAGRGLNEPRYTDAAAKAAGFLLKTLKQKDGRLLHRYRDGQAAIVGMLEDYAFLVWGLCELFQATQDPRWLAEAKGLADVMIEDLWDDKDGAFFQVPASSTLIARPKPTYDGAIPSGNSAAAMGLALLGHLTGERGYVDKANATLKWFSYLLVHSGGHSSTLGLQALDATIGPPREVVIAGDPADPEVQAMLREVNRRFLPDTVVILRPLGDAKELVKVVPYVGPQTAKDGKATAYVCENYACNAPVTDLDALKTLLDAAQSKVEPKKQ